MVYIYFEYDENIKEENFEIRIDIEVSLDNESFYKKSYSEYSRKNYYKYEISTDGTWPIDERYEVVVNIFDNISKESYESIIYFNLLKEISIKPKITVLDPANEIRGYKDYNYSVKFSKNETIYIYEEYTNITTVNITECDLYLEIDVTKNDISIYNDNAEKKEIGNNAHKWFFTSNSSWEIGLYYVKAILIDNISNKETNRITNFIII
jgi:hypothetical protein